MQVFFTIFQCQMLSAPNINQAPESDRKVFSAPRASQSLRWHHFSANYVLTNTVWPRWVNLYFCKLQKNIKMNWNNFLQRLWNCGKKSNTWKMRHLVNESFVPVTQQTSISYWRLLDFYCLLIVIWTIQNISSLL